MTVRENVLKILRQVPEGVILEAAAKGRPVEAVREAIDAGIGIIGENYIQEAEQHYRILGNCVKWHFIGHLQKNKVKKAVTIFDMIETVDSLELAAEIDRKCRAISRTMPVLIEVNSGREPQKHGVFPENVIALVREMAIMPNIKIMGLMTMGPALADPGGLRPYFVETRTVFAGLKKLELPSVRPDYLSMGMSNSYLVAIEEGANLIRLGSKLFT